MCVGGGGKKKKSKVVQMQTCYDPPENLNPTKSLFFDIIILGIHL